MTTGSTSPMQDPYDWVFDGSYQIVSTIGTAQVLSGDFTIEFWYYQTSGSPTFQLLFDSGDTSGLEIFMEPGTISTPAVHHNAVGDIIVSAGGNTSLNVWHHLAAVRQGDEMYLWIDGILEGTAANTAIFPSGVYHVGHLSFIGDMAGVRVSKYARYLTPFTPPTTQFHTNLLGGT